MRRRGKELLSLSFSLHNYPMHHHPLAKSPPPPPTFSTSSSKPITPPTSVEEKNKSPSNPQRDSMILEHFRQRKLKGSSNKSLSKGTTTTTTPHVSTSLVSTSNSTPEKVVEKVHQNEGETEPTMVVANFEELGLSEELVQVLEGIGDFVPSEIQCVAIPSILEGKSLLLSSPCEPHRTLAFLLPLIQLLRRDADSLGLNSKHPRAIVLCATEEKAAQCFNAAKYIIHNAESKAAKGSASPDNKQSNTSIGLIIGTSSEILQFIEEGSVVPAELRYMVLDDVDYMLGNDLGPEIQKIVRPLLDHESNSTVKRLQTVLTISTITEVLGEQSFIVKNLERDHAGNVSAMSLEMDQTEVFHFIESMDALKKKVAEAMDSFLK